MTTIYCEASVCFTQLLGANCSCHTDPEACATQDVRTPQRNSTIQADIVEQIRPAIVRYPGLPIAIRPVVGYIRQKSVLQVPDAL